MHMHMHMHTHTCMCMCHYAWQAHCRRGLRRRRLLRAEIAEIAEVALEMARRGEPATAHLGMAMLSDLVVVVSS